MGCSLGCEGAGLSRDTQSGGAEVKGKSANKPYSRVTSNAFPRCPQEPPAPVPAGRFADFAPYSTQ